MLLLEVSIGAITHFELPVESLAINLQGASLDRKEIHILFVHVLFSYARLQVIMHNILGQFALEVKLLTCESSLLIKLQICRHLKAVIMQLVTLVLYRALDPHLI
ncbi:hypothetical protein D5086_029393 [Populus alba]|uniref:Uncharacterized protein n=1 Tax=Populus alba TaxID=43335 RepID=A0ACC4ATC4_POPAL